MVKIRASPEQWFVVCTPGGGLCVETTNEQKAKTIAKVLQSSIHSDMSASRSADQNG